MINIDPEKLIQWDSLSEDEMAKIKERCLSCATDDEKEDFLKYYWMGLQDGENSINPPYPVKRITNDKYVFYMGYPYEEDILRSIELLYQANHISVMSWLLEFVNIRKSEDQLTQLKRYYENNIEQLRPKNL